MSLPAAVTAALNKLKSATDVGAMVMSDPKNVLDNATIKWNGSAREAGPNGEPIQVFVVETTQGSFWFEVYYKYAENDNDFWIAVGNFGLHRKSAAGSTTPLVRRSFSAAEAQIARDRLEALFLGPRDNPSLPILPFRWGRGRCLGVTFLDGWITVK